MDSQASSESSGKPKFTLHNSKLQVYAQNAIKRSNVKAFVNQGVRYSQRLNMQNNQNKNLSHHLLHLKNSCNDLKKDITNKQNQAVKLKDQTCYTSQKVKQLQSQRQKLEQKITNLTKDVQMVQTKKQATFHTLKTYEQILSRMKKDEITNQIRRNNLQKTIHNIQKQSALVQNKLYSLKDYEQLSLKGIKQAHQQIQNENQERYKKVTEMNEVLQEKKVSEIKKQQRHNQTKSIQQMAAGDLQDADLIRMKKFLQVQIFVKFLLKDKMQRLKNRYEPYQMAYFKIKSQTSAKDANSLKSQFFNFQQQYQERTAWIKHLQEQISGLQSQKTQLNEQLSKAMQQELELLQQFQDNQPHQNSYDHVTIHNDKQTMCKRSLDCELTSMKVRQWIHFQARRVSANSSVSEENCVVKNFNRICDFLLENKQKQLIDRESTAINMSL